VSDWKVLIEEIERRRNDPEFRERLDRLIEENAGVLNRLEPHLGPVGGSGDSDS